MQARRRTDHRIKALAFATLEAKLLSRTSFRSPQRQSSPSSSTLRSSTTASAVTRSWAYLSPVKYERAALPAKRVLRRGEQPKHAVLTWSLEATRASKASSVGLAPLAHCSEVSGVWVQKSRHFRTVMRADQPHVLGPACSCQELAPLLCKHPRAGGRARRLSACSSSTPSKA